MKDSLINLLTVDISENNDELVIIDQTKLPNTIEILRLSKQEDIWNAIKTLQVRGAPAIGVAAAIGAYIAASQIDTDNYEKFMQEFKKSVDYLASSRPTAVNLFWALDRMYNTAKNANTHNVQSIKKLLLQEAKAIHAEDIDVCRRLGENGLSLIKDGYGILTHCNAGQLATVKYGTALAPIHLGREKGMNFRVFTDETRPLLQGARLSAFELVEDGVDTTLICDNMASIVMKNGWVDAIFVGCDRVAANGDAANKIGTSGVAILAKHYNIPFYVVAPSSTIDISLENGSQIPIEERPAEEVSQMWYKEPMAPKNVKVFNPAFDVTDNELISAIVTEYGVLKPPYKNSIANMFKEHINKDK